MTRYAELSRKAESLWRAASVCGDANMINVYADKACELKAMMRGLSIDQAEQPATDRRNHVLSAVWLTIGEYFVFSHESWDRNDHRVRALYDINNHNPITWGELIERMNVR